MYALTEKQVYWTSHCGLPAKYLLTQIILDYAVGRLTLSEYEDFYNRMGDSQKKIADKLVEEISKAVIFDSNGKAK